MQTVSLSGSSRESVGKKDARDLRGRKLVPSVLYGGEKQYHFSLDLIDLEKYVYTPDVFTFEISISGEKHEAILKDLQFHPVTDKIIHADFLEIIEGKEVKLDIPVSLVGNSIGVRNGGRLARNFRRISVRGLPKDFPDNIELDITPLRIGMALRISDIDLPNVTLLHDPESIVVAVKAARGALEDELEEEGEEGEEGEGEAGEEAKEGADKESESKE